MSDALSHDFLDVDIETGVANGRLLAYLAQHGEILSRTYADDRVSIHCRMPRKFLGQIPPQEAVIRHACSERQRPFGCVDKRQRWTPTAKWLQTDTRPAARVATAMALAPTCCTSISRSSMSRLNNKVAGATPQHLSPGRCPSHASVEQTIELRRPLLYRRTMGRLYIEHGSPQSYRSTCSYHRCLKRDRAGAGD